MAEDIRGKVEWILGGKQNGQQPQQQAQPPAASISSPSQPIIQQAPAPPAPTQALILTPLPQAQPLPAAQMAKPIAQNPTPAAPRRSNGVNINLLSQQMLDAMAGEEKITFVLNEVKVGKILVLEYGLTPAEQTKLIERTMMEIDPETFIGIEIQSYSAEAKHGFFQNIFGKAARPRMTVIGPADLLRIVHKDNQVIQTMVLTGKNA
ncbi:MAG: DUF2073 domain-containing protein [Candidatus Thermoplasmatota archaeon]|nr:DUF2073 domain-containing protein [Candidatus Thermoplasmatota archaeon]